MAYQSTLDPEWAAISPHVPQTEPIGSIQAYREVIAGIVKAKVEADPGPTEGLKVVEKKVPVVNGEILVKAFIPDAQPGETGGFPLLFWLYGGGWTVNSLAGEEPFLRNLAINSRTVCVGADYPKAPERPFPAAVDDSYAALKWALAEASQLSINVSKGVIVGGFSSGGNVSAVLVQRGSKDPEVKDLITGQLLVMPCVIMPQAYPDKFKSELHSVDNPNIKHFVTKDHLLKFTEAYLSGSDPTNPEISPALAESFEQLPPTYIQVAGMDLLRDEGILYERLLREAGVRTRIHEYEGQPHGFHFAFKDFKASKKQEKDFLEGIRWLLGRPE